MARQLHCNAVLPRDIRHIRYEAALLESPSQYSTLTSARQAFSAALVLKHFGSINKEQSNWKPAGCEVALLEAFVMQVAPLLHFMRAAAAKIIAAAPFDTTPSIGFGLPVQEVTVISNNTNTKPKQRRNVATSGIVPIGGAEESESQISPSKVPMPDAKLSALAPEIVLLQTALGAMGDLTIHCHGAFLHYDGILRCFVLDPQLLLFPGNNRPSFTPKFIEDARLNMSKQLLPADMYPFSEPMLQRQLLYVPDAAHEASVQRALSDVHAGSTVSSQNVIISSMFQSLYGCGSLIACGFWSEEQYKEGKGSTDAGYKGTFVMWAERLRTIPQHMCAVVESICHRASQSILHIQRQSLQDCTSSLVASGTVGLIAIRTSFSKRLIHIVQELLPSIFSSTSGNSMLDTTYAFAVWTPASHSLIDGFTEISELQLVACTVDGRLIHEQMDRLKLENYPVLLQAWVRGGIVCIDGRGCFGCSDASGTIVRTRELFGVPQDRIMCETAIATVQHAGSECVLAAVQVLGCQRAQGYTESELNALSQVTQMLGGFILQEQENISKQRAQLKTNRMVASFNSLLSTASLSLGKITFDVVNSSDLGTLSLCEENILKSFPLKSVRSQMKTMLMQVNARSAAFILVDATESSVILVLQVVSGAAYSDSDRQPKQCLLQSCRGLVYKCIKTRKPVVYNHESREPLDAEVDHMARDKFTTSLLAPIILENRVAAVVQVFSKLREDSGYRHGKGAITPSDSVKPVDSNELHAAFQRSRAHMHMLRSGRADLMALERLPVLESTELCTVCSPNWRAEASASVFEQDDIEIVVAASETCGQMVSLAFRAAHSVKVAANMSRFAHLIQVEDSGETLSKYACKVIVELLTSSISPRPSCVCSVFLSHQSSKGLDPTWHQTGTFREGVAPRSLFSEKDVETVKQIVVNKTDDSSIICCPIQDSLVSQSSGDSEIMGVMAVQIPDACQSPMSDAEVDAMKVVCQHLAEALKNSFSLVRTAKERANRKQYEAIDFLGNCLVSADVNSMMICICKELNSFIKFDSAAAFTVKARNPESIAALSIDREWFVSHFPDDCNRLSAQPGVLRVLGTEVLTGASSIGPLVIDGPESAGNMFGHYQLARAVQSTKVSIHHSHPPKKWTSPPLHGCIFGVPLSSLQENGSLNICGSVVLVRDGHESK